MADTNHSLSLSLSLTPIKLKLKLIGNGLGSIEEDTLSRWQEHNAHFTAVHPACDVLEEGVRAGGCGSGGGRPPVE